MGLQGLYSLSGKSCYHQISRNLKATILGVIIIVSFWNLTGISAAQQRCCRCACQIQGVWKSLNPNLLASRLRAILRWIEAQLGSVLISIDANYNDVIMSAMASQITSLTIVYSTVYSGADQRKIQSSASLAFVTSSRNRGFDAGPAVITMISLIHGLKITWTWLSCLHFPHINTISCCHGGLTPAVMNFCVMSEDLHLQLLFPEGRRCKKELF